MSIDYKDFKHKNSGAAGAWDAMAYARVQGKKGCAMVGPSDPEWLDWVDYFQAIGHAPRLKWMRHVLEAPFVLDEETSEKHETRMGVPERSPDAYEPGWRGRYDLPKYESSMIRKLKEGRQKLVVDEEAQARRARQVAEFINEMKTAVLNRGQAGVWVNEGTPQWHAWRKFQRKNGGVDPGPPFGGGAYFATPWPPFEPQFKGDAR